MLRRHFAAATASALVFGRARPLRAADGVMVVASPAPFAFRVPRGDRGGAHPFAVLVHGAGQAPEDLVAHPALASLADVAGVVLVAPGGDETDGRAIAAAADAAQRHVGRAVPLDAQRRYLGGYSNGVFGAFHLLAAQGGVCRGFLGIAGVLLRQDAFAVTLRLAGTGAYLVAGARDPVIASGAVRSTVRVLRAGRVFARYYEVPDGTHDLATLDAGIRAAWNDMFDGVTQIPNDGLGTIAG